MKLLIRAISSRKSQARALKPPCCGSSLCGNYRIPGGQGSQEPIQSSRLLQRPPLRAPRPDALPDTTKQSLDIFAQWLTYSIVLDFPKAKVGGLGGNVGVVRMNDWTRASNSRTFQQPSSQTSRPSVAAKGTSFQQEGKIDDNWSVQWQNDSGENQIPETPQRGVQGKLQELSRLPPVQPADANDSVKTRSTLSLLSQTGFKSTTLHDTFQGCLANSTATRPANAAASPVPHINPVGIRKGAQNSNLSQAVPTGQLAVALPFTPGSMAANPPVDLVYTATLNMENCNMTDLASFPTFADDFGGFDLDACLESSAEDVGGFYFNYFPSNINADNIDQS
ncbi:hypothetical protein QL093DRAFT_2565283 [Fusarium oxysporum]|nr:hypothetical protein QL093DRAFT_2565283 [Fusarium oxysporum]